jgi:UDP-glucuronate decarboxylase
MLKSSTVMSSIKRVFILRFPVGTFNLLEAVEDANVKRIIHFSSSEIYGSCGGGVAESASPMSAPVTHRRWVYSVSKLAGEHAILRYGETRAMNVTVVRPFNIYGPRQTGEGAISNFARRLGSVWRRF